MAPLLYRLCLLVLGPNDLDDNQEADNPKHLNPLLISTGFLKYPFGHLFQTEIKIQL